MKKFYKKILWEFLDFWHAKGTLEMDVLHRSLSNMSVEKQWKSEGRSYFKMKGEYGFRIDPSAEIKFPDLWITYAYLNDQKGYCYEVLEFFSKDYKVFLLHFVNKRLVSVEEKLFPRSREGVSLFNSFTGLNRSKSQIILADILLIIEEYFLSPVVKTPHSTE